MGVDLCPVFVLLLAGRPGQSLRAFEVLWNDLRPVARIQLSLAAELVHTMSSFLSFSRAGRVALR